MALDVSSSISLAGVVLTAIGGIIAAGTYIVSIEKRLNGKAALAATLASIEAKQDSTLAKIEAKQDTQGAQITDLMVAVGRIEELVNHHRQHPR